MLPASRAAIVPVFIATPTSAWASAGRVVGAVAAHGDELALALLVADEAQLVLGRRLREEVVDAGLRRRSPRRSAGLSPVIITVRMPICRSSAKRSRMPPLTMSLRWMTPRTRSSCATASGVPPAREMRSTIGMQLRRRRVALADVVEDGVDRALADLVALDIDAAHPRLRRERDELRVERAPSRAPRSPYFSFASTTIERPSGVSSLSEESCAASASSRSSTPGSGDELGRLAVAEGDRAGLVEQQRVDVARRLDRAARHGEHVEAHQPVHAGDADRRQKRADGRRDQGDEQRDQHHDRDGAAGIGGEARDRHGGEHEDDASCPRAGC